MAQERADQIAEMNYNIQALRTEVQNVQLQACVDKENFERSCTLLISKSVMIIKVFSVSPDQTLDSILR